MARKILVALTVANLWATCAMAQTAELPDPFKFMPAEQVVALTAQPGPGAKTTFITRHDNFNVEYAVRTDTGNLTEIHMHSAHYISILEGEGTLTYGGTVSDGKETAPGETRGGKIQNGTNLALHAGDYLQIPAGMPHLLVASAGKKLRYVLFNIRQ